MACLTCRCLSGCVAVWLTIAWQAHLPDRPFAQYPGSYCWYWGVQLPLRRQQFFSQSLLPCRCVKLMSLTGTVFFLLFFNYRKWVIPCVTLCQNSNGTNVPQTFRYLIGLKQTVWVRSQIYPIEKDYLYLVQESRYWTKPKYPVFKTNSRTIPKGFGFVPKPMSERLFFRFLHYYSVQTLCMHCYKTFRRIPPPSPDDARLILLYRGKRLIYMGREFAPSGTEVFRNHRKFPAIFTLKKGRIHMVGSNSVPLDYYACPLPLDHGYHVLIVKKYTLINIKYQRESIKSNI
jgi:hypothetical protein